MYIFKWRLQEDLKSCYCSSGKYDGRETTPISENGKKVNALYLKELMDCIYCLKVRGWWEGRQSDYRITILEAVWCPGRSGRLAGFLGNRYSRQKKKKVPFTTWYNFILIVKSNLLITELKAFGKTER